MLLEYVQNLQPQLQTLEVRAGDWVCVHEEILDGKKNRIQKFQGIIIQKKGKLNTLSLLIRKESYGFWVEKRFFINSPLIKKIELVSKGRARRAKLTYLKTSKNLTALIKRLKIR